MTLRSDHVGAARTGGSTTLVLLVTSLAYFLVILDTTAKNVALPSLARDMGASVTDLQWVVSSYLLVFSSLLLTGGLLCDRLGGKRVFLVGFALFGVGSLISAIAPDIPVLIGGQVVAGVGAALVTPASLAILITTFTDPGDRGRALGTWAAIAGAGMAFGPLVGGLLTSAIDWRAVFWLNVPIVAVALVLTARAVAAAVPARSRHFDPLGQVLGIAALGMLTAGIIHAGDTSWTDPLAVGLVVGGVVSGVVFVVVEKRTPEAMVPMSVFAARRPLTVILTGVALNFCTFGVMFLLSLYFQDVRGYSAVLTGVAELPMSLLCVLLPGWVGRIQGRSGPWRPLLVGLVALAVGSALLVVIAADVPYWACVPGLLLMGVGIAFAVPAISSAATVGVPASLAGSASATLSAARQMGGVLGVSILGSLVAGDLAGRATVSFAVVAAVVVVAAVGIVAVQPRK